MGKIEWILFLQGLICILVGATYSLINFVRLFVEFEMTVKGPLPGIELGTLGLIAIVVAVRK